MLARVKVRARAGVRVKVKVRVKRCKFRPCIEADVLGAIRAAPG